MKPSSCTLRFKFHFLDNVSLSYIAFNAVLHLTLRFNQVRSCHMLSPSGLFIYLSIQNMIMKGHSLSYIYISKTNKHFLSVWIKGPRHLSFGPRSIKRSEQTTNVE